MINQHQVVFGLVPDRAIAETIVTDLHRAGFENGDISLLMPDDGVARDVVLSEHTKAPEGAVAGGTTGGVVGGTLGLLVGIGVLIVPGLGPLVAGGPIVAALSGAAVGAAFGSLAGLLVGLGIPELEAKVYEGKVKLGSGLLAVHVDDLRHRRIAQNVLELHLAEDVAWTVASDGPDRFARSTRLARG